MRDNYQTCIVKMEQFEDFTHRSTHKINMRGTQFCGGVQFIKCYNFDYIILSYTTMICFVNFRDKTYCINPQKFSTTTSRQVSYILRAVKVWERKGFERILWI
jgi:hypothetical protein